jgi:predicted DNA-binding transcriptional regulator AlpA
MARDPRILPAALKRPDAAAFCGMSTTEFGQRYRAGELPAPSRFGNGVPRWSRDELRAWMAHGCPPVERWGKVWAGMIKAGTWAAPEVVIVEERPA